MNIDDEATSREEHERGIALKYRKPEPKQNTGRCQNCGDPINKGSFCCIECREDWELIHHRY